MKICLGTVCWGGYLERYVNIFVDNYITLFKKLIGLNISWENIPDPKIVYVQGEDIPGFNTEAAIIKLKKATGKDLKLICDKHKYTVDTIMYSTRNRLRNEFRKDFPDEEKVYFYFPIDDRIRSEAALELIKLTKSKTPAACMFKFFVDQGGNNFTAGTRPICSYKDIHPGDWGGYCAYNILKEDDCPLYPKIAIPNVAFYAELYKAGYKQYESEKICIDHLRHGDSHHFKYKDTTMATNVRNYLMKVREQFAKEGLK